jgi:hypothetical protein
MVMQIAAGVLIGGGILGLIALAMNGLIAQDEGVRARAGAHMLASLIAAVIVILMAFILPS